MSVLGIYLVCVLPFLGTQSFAATSDIVQIDIGDATVPIRHTTAISDGGKGVLDNGDALFYGVSSLSPYNYQIYKYTHATGATEIVSVNSAGEMGNADSLDLAYTPDGRYIAFYSYATNLVDGDTLGNLDIFVRDTQLGTTKRVSVAADGTEANGDSRTPSISDDGRYVAFESIASNLVVGDTNGNPDVFVRDTVLNTTSRVSVNTAGDEEIEGAVGASISADGRYVSFESSGTGLVADDTNGYTDIFMRDTQLNTTTRVSVATDGTESNNQSNFAIISADGRYVVFHSDASNLVVGDTNAKTDVFMRDTLTSTTTRVSVSTAGVEGNLDSTYASISADGRYIAFQSTASNLVADDTSVITDVFVRDTQLNTTTRVSVVTGGAEANSDSYTPSISPNGRYITFGSVASNLFDNDVIPDSDDMFIHDTQTGTTTHISNVYTSIAFGSSPDDFSQYRNNMSTDGRYVAFSSYSGNLVNNDTNGISDIFVRDTQLNTATRISVSTAGVQGNSISYMPSMSADGRYVAFLSDATNLVAGDTNNKGDVFVRDMQLGTTTRVSLSTAGVESDDYSYIADMSANGRYVAFTSSATNLVAGDTNGLYDVFVRDLQENTTTRVSLKNDGTEILASSYNPVISEDGRYVAFDAPIDDVVPDIDTNSQSDVFIRDTLLGTTTLVSINSAGTASANGESIYPIMSPDGRYITFESSASDLVNGDLNNIPDIFVRDMQLGTTTIVSVAADGTQTDSSVSGSSISADGKYISFASNAGSLGSNGAYDVYVKNMLDNSIIRLPTFFTGQATEGGTFYPTLSPDGSKVAFVSEAVSPNAFKNYYIVTLPVAEVETTPTTSSNSAGGILTELPPNKLITTTEQPKNQNEVPVTTSAPLPAFVFVKNTRVGSRNVEVLELQKFLNKNGFIVSTVGWGSVGYETKYFGKATKKALINYQKANKLKADGTMNAKTIKFINKFNKQNL